VSAAFETIVGKVCVERGWVSRDQLVDCLRQVATSVDTPLPESSKSRLSDMLISRGLVTEEQMVALRDEVSRILASDSAYTVVRRDDAAFGQILVTAGACTKEQVIEALSIQQHLADKGGPAPRLGEILLQKGYVTFAAIERALESQNGKTTLHCVSCRSQYSVVDFNPKKKYLCKKCSGSLLPPGELPSDVPEEIVAAQKNPKNLLGKYVLLKELGRGGMGVVYQAWESSLRRWVALKVLLNADGQEELVRFRREAQTAASLRHPNIVGIYEVCDIGDKHVIAMEYVDGRSLAGERFSAVKAAEALIPVARAVEFAHSRGIIHRDIKPHNIMIDREGKAFVMDFGLAKSLQAQSHITMTGTVVGTPSYMAPEQAAGRVSLVGRQSDLYSLGAVLYEMLTGLPPFKGPNPVETLRMVVNDDVRPPSVLNASVPKDMETIVLKCLEKEPSRRYADAGELAQDLERFAGGREIVARRDHAAAVVARKVKRQWLPIAAAAATLLAVALTIAFVATRGPAKADEVRALLQRGDRLAEAGDLRGALTKYEAARTLDAANAEVKERLSDVTQRIKATDRDEAQRREEAKAKAQREIGPGRAKLTRVETLVYQQGADYGRMSALLAEAIEHFTRALLLLPGDPELLHLRGQAQALLRNHTDAEKDFTAALKADKNYSVASYDRARLWLALALDDDEPALRGKARADLEAYRKSGGDREMIDVAEAALAVAEHDAAKALQACDRLIGRGTQNDEVFKIKGDAFAEMARKAAPEMKADLYRQSIQCHTEAISRRPNYADALLARGNARFEIGKFGDALADWEKAFAFGIPRNETLLKRFNQAKGRVGG